MCSLHRFLHTLDPSHVLSAVALVGLVSNCCSHWCVCVCVCEGGFTGHPTWEQEREGKSRTPNLNQNIGVLDLEKGPIFKVLVGIFVHRML